MASENEGATLPTSQSQQTVLKNGDPPAPPRCLSMVRPGFGTDGRPIKLLSNHFRVKLDEGDPLFFYHYSVSIRYEDKHAVEGKGLCRGVLDKLNQTYSTELAGKQFAYDGEKSLYTVGPLPQNNFEFTVLLEESTARSIGGSTLGNGSPSQGVQKKSKQSLLAKTFRVGLSYAAKIPLRSIALALRGSEPEHTQDALRVLDIVLQQQQAKRGCLIVRQSYFGSAQRNDTVLSGGISGCHGFHSSFHTTQGGLSLIMDVSTTLTLTPGPVLNFLLDNQNVKLAADIDWVKAKRMLKNMRIKTVHTSVTYKITGISELPCFQQTFLKKVKNDGEEEQTLHVTVYDYFVNKKIELSSTVLMPCLDVGKPKRPNYLPIELCHLVPLQRYTKALSSQQRASLIEKSRQKPPERIGVVTTAVRSNHYDEDPMLASCGVFIEKQLAPVEGRVLSAPTLKVGNNEDCLPFKGRWNFNNKTLWQPKEIDRWIIVNFSARCDMSHLSRELITCGRKRGISIDRPYTLIEEDHRWIRFGPVIRVEKMFDQIRKNLPCPPLFILCVLSEKKNSPIYGPWKKKNLHELGIVTQCIAPTKINDQYLTNVLLKINSKLGGINSLLDVEHTRSIPLLSQTPTMILGMDVSHGSPGRADIPSIAAVVGSRYWPQISSYRAAVRTQSPKAEMIDSLYKPLANGEDDGIARELLLDFYATSCSKKPSQIVIFRDGVSESQFSQVLNTELDQIIKAFHHLGESTLPKFTVIVAQKKHHTRLFQANAPENVPPGTVVDTKVVHPKNYDFFMCAHAGSIGTSRPTHYHVLLDEIGFSPDELQKLVHSLCYVYQRSTTAVSIVAPICYAHLAAKQMSQFINFEGVSETSSGHCGTTSSEPSIPELPRLHDNVCSSMFFC